MFKMNRANQFQLPGAVANARLDVATTNRVLRNTYILLAITMLPTIAGAYLGTLFPLRAMVPLWLYFVIFIGGAWAFSFPIIKNRNNVAGVWWLLAFTLFLGYILGGIVGFALYSYSNGAQLVGMAAGGTAAIFFVIAGFATTTKRDFSGMSLSTSFSIGLTMMIVLMWVNAFFIESSAIVLAISSLIIVIASGLILFTINRVVRGGEDNYILVTMTVYIMLFNLFVSLLNLLTFFAGDRE